MVIRVKTVYVEGSPAEVAEYERLREQQRMETACHDADVGDDEEDTEFEERTDKFLSKHMDDVLKTDTHRTALLAITKAGDDGLPIADLCNVLSTTENGIKGVMGSLARKVSYLRWPIGVDFVNRRTDDNGNRVYFLDEKVRRAIQARINTGKGEGRSGSNRQ